LVGEDIPEEGRIAALCDVFDALTSERPYKKAWPIEEAIQFIKDNAGSHFDPNMATKFIEIMPTILDIRGKYADEEISYANPHLMGVKIPAE